MGSNDTKDIIDQMETAYLPDISVPSVLNLSELPDFEKYHKKDLASDYVEFLMEYIHQCEEMLEPDNEHEIGMKLVTFGQSIMLHVRFIDWCDPSLISFSGQLDDGDPAQLIQHVSQISFLLTVVKRSDTSTPKKRIGFRALCDAD